MTHRIYEVPGDGPTIVALHPASTAPEAFAKLVGPVAGFRVLYPEAAKDLRWSHLGDEDIDFLKGIDAQLVAGYSSGGFMAHRLIREKSYKGAMILAAGLLRPYAASWAFPTRVLMCNGMADANVPYDGVSGPLGYLGALDSAVALRKLVGAPARMTHPRIPNAANDGTRPHVDDWSNKVRLISVEGMGHTWPSTSGVWQPPTLGKVCRDFSLTEKMAEWFSAP